MEKIYLCVPSAKLLPETAFRDDRRICEKFWHSAVLYFRYRLSWGKRERGVTKSTDYKTGCAMLGLNIFEAFLYPGITGKNLSLFRDLTSPPPLGFGGRDETDYKKGCVMRPKFFFASKIFLAMLVPVPY